MSSVTLAYSEETDSASRAMRNRSGDMGSDSADMATGVLGLFGVKIVVRELDMADEWEEEQELLFQESEKVVSWLEGRESVKSKESRRGVGRAVAKAGAWWRKTWESNKAAAGSGGFM